MITIFNRKELFATFDMEKYVEVKNLLTEQKIDYYIKAEDFNRLRDRQTIGTIGEKIMIEYKIYVRKSDYDQAVYAIQKRH